MLAVLEVLNGTGTKFNQTIIVFQGILLIKLFLTPKPIIIFQIEFTTKGMDDKWFRSGLFVSNVCKGFSRKVCKESSRLEVFCKKGIFRNFAKFKGKNLYQSLLFNKVAGLRPATLLKKRLGHMCFPVNFAKFLRTHFLTEHIWWLILSFVIKTFCN